MATYVRAGLPRGSNRTGRPDRRGSPAGDQPTVPGRTPPSARIARGAAMITICQLLGALPLGLGGGRRWSSSAEGAPVGVFVVAGRQRLALGQPEIRSCSRTGAFSCPIFPRALRQHPAEVAVLRPELDAPGVIGPGLAALRAGAGQLLIPPDPGSRPSGRSATSSRLIQVWSFRLPGPGPASLSAMLAVGPPQRTLPGGQRQHCAQDGAASAPYVITAVVVFMIPATITAMSAPKSHLSAASVYGVSSSRTCAFIVQPPCMGYPVPSGTVIPCTRPFSGTPGRRPGTGLRQRRATGDFRIDMGDDQGE
jgi:hypothetical protein